MRRTTSALTTTILGAVLSASTVSAQQSLPSASARRAGDPAPPPATAGADAAEHDAGFGMAAARGPRYLLRNGLDYIEYQEYDRALKYLREAEKRQAELGSSEKLKLKQGIERAQRGLREAVGSEKPYALSSRTRRPRGVVVAKSESRGGASSATASKPASSPSRREGDDRGEPIRLTGVDVPAEAAAAGLLPAAPADGEPAPPPADPSPLADLPQPPETPVAAADVGGDRARGPAPVEAPAPVAMEAPALVPVKAPDPAPAVFGGVSTASAPAPSPAADPAADAQADLTTPFPDLTAAESSAKPADSAPAPAPAPATTAAPAPAPADSGLTLSATSPEPAAPASSPITLETPADPAPAPAPASSPITLETPVDPAPADAGLPTLPPLGAAEVPEPAAPAVEPEAPRVAAAPADVPAADLDLPALPSDLQDRPDAAGQPLPAAADELPPLPGGPSGAPADQAPSVAPLSGASDRPVDADAAREAIPVPAEADTETPVPVSPADLVPLPGELEKPAADPAPLPAEVPAPVQETPAPAPAPEPEPEAASPEPAAAAAPAPVEEAPAESASPVEPARTALAPREPAGSTRSNPGSVERSESLLPERPAPVSTLSPELKSRVEEVAARQEEEYRLSQAQPRQTPPSTPSPDAGAVDLRSQTQLDISRAPSPAEARPIRAIPVPEDWVPLGARQWTAQRKYWAAAATCHMPLYFQDPMLERYGHSVEAFAGPKGRFFAYPVDDPSQTTQRNQLVQPWFSAGLFAGQILALPYNLIMDPPWEAQYDLGYWRPGDRIPTDMYYLPLHGTGPPLRGRKY